MEEPAEYTITPAPKAGQLVRARETMLSIPMKVKGHEVIWKNGNKIIDRMPLKDFLAFCQSAGLNSLIDYLGIVDRARFHQGDSASMVYDLPVLQRRYLGMSEQDRRAMLADMTRQEAAAFLEDMRCRLEQEAGP
jgi:hypothetical protein